jgi:hypothetical protein
MMAGTQHSHVSQKEHLVACLGTYSCSVDLGRNMLTCVGWQHVAPDQTPASAMDAQSLC